MAAAPRPDAGAPVTAPAATPVPTRIEGYIKSISGADWLVDQTPVLRGPNTTLIERRGAAAVGAYVLVVGQQVATRLEADTIEVLRPVGAPAPSYQFTGTLRKQGNAAWMIDNVPIDMTPATVTDPGIAPNSLVRVTVRRVDNRLEALTIEAIAADAASVPFAIEGAVERVTDDAWIVDGQPIVVPQEQGAVAGQGDTVEVKAVRDGAGALVAQETRLVDPAVDVLSGYVKSVSRSDDDSQTWNVMVFKGNTAEPRTIHVAPETYVDEDRAVIEPKVEARIQVAEDGAGVISADRIRLEQPVPAGAAGALTAGGPNQLSSVGEQPVWFESDALLQEAQAITAWGAGSNGTAAAKTSAGVSVRGVRLSNGVLIAQEVMSVDAAGAMPAGDTPSGDTATGLTADDWQGPIDINASLTSASKPTVLFDASGGGHAVYESLGKIYYAYQSPAGGWGAPRKIATGFKPAAAFDSLGVLHVAYTNSFMGNYDILHVQLTPAGWSLARVVAPTSGKSDDPAIAAGANGTLYVAWMDFTSGEWAVQIGRWDGNYWTSYPVPNGRGQSPAAAVLSDGALVLAWQDRLPLGANAWGAYDIFVSERLGSNTVWTLPINVSENRNYRPGSDALGARLVADHHGLAHVAWIDNAVQVRYDYGRGLYWPLPVDVTDKRPVARGLSMQTTADGQLYIAWDEGASLRVTAGPLGEVDWPNAITLATRAAPANGSVFDVSLAAGGDGVSVSWVQRNLSGGMGVYESRYNMQPVVLRYYLPWTTAP